MTTTIYPEITDATMIHIERAGGVDNPPPCTWAVWKADNADGFSEEEFADIAAAIRDPACKCIMGGGAQSLAYISRADEVTP
jgi:hypothetical protein